MSVIIEGMKMPKYCGDCGIYESCRNSWADIETVPKSIQERPEYCPLIDAYNEFAVDLKPFVVDNKVLENCWVCGNCGSRVMWPVRQLKNLKYCWHCGRQFKEVQND